MHSADCAVFLSLAGILLKQRNVSSHFFNPLRSHTILVLTVPNAMTILRWGPPNWGIKFVIFSARFCAYTVVQKKNAPTLADYNYDPVQSILIIFSRLFANDHKSCLVVKFSTSPHTCCHYTLWNTMLYFSLITLLIAKNAPTSDDHNFNKR